MSGKKGNATAGKGRNDDRKCGKAWKQHKRTGQEGVTGRTIGGYTPAKIAERARKRGGAS